MGRDAEIVRGRNAESLAVEGKPAKRFLLGFEAVDARLLAGSFFIGQPKFDMEELAAEGEEVSRT